MKLTMDTQDESIIIHKINPKEARVEFISEVDPEAVVSEDGGGGRGRKNSRRLGRASGVQNAQGKWRGGCHWNPCTSVWLRYVLRCAFSSSCCVSDSTVARS